MLEEEVWAFSEGNEENSLLGMGILIHTLLWKDLTAENLTSENLGRGRN